MPKDDCNLQGHLGPHFQAPDVGGGNHDEVDDGSGNDEADDEGGFHRGEQKMFLRPNIKL